MKIQALLIPGLLALVVSNTLAAQTPAPPPAKGPTFEERLAARAAENRYAVSYQNGAFSGPGWERLIEEGRKSLFFLIGEEHGVAEIPAVARELFRALRSAGYQHLAIEISPPMAAALDETARGADGLQKL